MGKRFVSRCLETWCKIERCGDRDLCLCPKRSLSWFPGCGWKRPWSLFPCLCVFICSILYFFVPCNQVQHEPGGACPHFLRSAAKFPLLASKWAAWLSQSHVWIPKNCLGKVIARRADAWAVLALVGNWSKCRPWQESCHGALLEASGVRNWSSLCCFCDLGWDQNPPQKNDSYSISACQRGVLFQTWKHYIKKKKRDPGEGRKKGAVSGEEVTRSWNQSFLRLFWAQFQEEVPVY